MIDRNNLQSVPFGQVPHGALVYIDGAWYRMVVLVAEDGLASAHIAYELLDQEHPETCMEGDRRGVLLSKEQVVGVFSPAGL
ncbi:hypothetical protein FJY94_04330 [Candidatus Kaiserbacteria bacterium]|nr:hypothetical protein [Candidatus Kaiserbacteria bacterium]